jgi:tRNA(Ile)-lysidine synthase
MRGSKKLQDFFVDRKVPRPERPLVPLVEDGAGIVWVAGHRVSERVRVTEATRRILRIEARRS